MLKLLVAAASVVASSAKEDLPKDASLRIGVKSKPESCDRKSKNGDKLSMHYTGTLYSDGTQFDSSVGRAPFDFTLGAGMVIKGWDNGLQDMCVGEKRKLVIPSDLGCEYVLCCASRRPLKASESRFSLTL